MDQEGPSPFLKPGRLADVKALIDKLARHPDYNRRSESALNRALGPPMSAARWITVLDEHPQFFENAGGEFPLVLRLRLDRVGPLTAKEIEELHQRAESYHADAHRASTSPHVDRKKIEESIKKEYMQVDEAIMNVKMYDSIKEAYRKAYN